MMDEKALDDMKCKQCGDIIGVISVNIKGEEGEFCCFDCMDKFKIGRKTSTTGGPKQ